MQLSFSDDSNTMGHKSTEANGGDRLHMECSELVAACANNTGNSDLWEELLRRHGPRLSRFIRSAWNLWLSGSSRGAEEVFGGEDQGDLFQAAVLLLIENDCAVMKRFSGSTEDEWLAYLAKIACSVVRDSARRQRRSKRFGRRSSLLTSSYPLGLHGQDRNCSGCRDVERRILALEVIAICERIIGNLSGHNSARDRLIFRLYFVHDLSINQIAECRGLTLSSSGVRDVINRMKLRVRGVIEKEERVRGGSKSINIRLSIRQGADAFHPAAN